MKVIAYLLSKEKNRDEQLIDIHKQKMAVFEYCKKHSCELTECKIELYEENQQKYPVLFSILAEHNLFDKIIFYQKDIFNDDEDFQEWLFDELKSKKIKFDYAAKTDKEIEQDDIEAKKNLIIQKAKNVPALPNTVVKTLQLIQNDKSSAWQLAKIMKYDTGLTGKILQLVNSTFYGFPKQISSIQHGITILGFNTIKGLVISSNIYKTFRKSPNDNPFNFDEFWMHTTICANFVNELSKHANCSEEEKEEMFSSAILHDIGKLILNQYDAENYKNVLINKHSDVEQDYNLKLEEKFCTLTHAQIGEVVINSWNLPEVIAQTAAFHHSPLNAKIEYQKAISIMYIANVLSNMVLNNLEYTDSIIDKDILSAAQIQKETIINLLKTFNDCPDRLSDLKKFLNEE